MSVIGSNILAGASGGAGAGGYEIERSLRFNSADTTSYLNRTFTATGSRTLWSWSAWVKKAANGKTVDQCLFGGYTASNDTDWFEFGFGGSSDHSPVDTFYWTTNNNTSSSSAIFRDNSAWYHCLVTYNGSNIKVYVNSTEVLTYSKTGNLGVNGAWHHTIGRSPLSSTTRYFDGYLADVHFIDDQALAPTDFGETDDNGVWQPKKFTGTYGTNGFRLDFADNSSNAALGTDTSGNNNTWTVNNLSVAAGAGNDSLVDTPTNGTQTDTGAGGEVVGNYATLNPLATTTNQTLSNGNLKCAANTNQWGSSPATIAITSGKYYFEATATSQTYNYVGIANSASVFSYNNPQNTNNYWGQSGNSWGYQSSAGTIINNGGTLSGTGTATSYGDGDVIGLAFDADLKVCKWYKNGTLIHTVTLSGSAPFFVGVGSYNSGASCEVNFGQRAFAHPVSGYKSLNTASLPEPTIADGSLYFDAKLYTGNSGTQSITGYNFSPDFLWIKSRTNPATGHFHHLHDSVRGLSSGFYKSLYSNGVEAENTYAGSTYGGVNSLNSDGFGLANVGSNYHLNNNTTPYVAWAWDAGANSDRTYTVTVSGGNFYIDGAQQPTLTLAEGSTYKFDQSASTNATHPLRFSTTSDGTHGGGTEYTTGVTTAGTPGSAGAYTQILIAASAPTLYAYCTNHSGMGFQVNTSDKGGFTIPAGSLNSSAYNQSQNWTNLITFNAGTWNGNGTNPFDADAANYDYGDTTRANGGYATLNISSLTGSRVISVTSQQTEVTITHDGGTTTFTPPNTSQITHTFDAVTNPTSIKFDGLNSNSQFVLVGVSVDGARLINSGISLPNVPSIASQVMANPSAGFSIVSYTGNNTAGASIGHGLNAAPELIICKDRDSSSGWWAVYSASQGNTKGAYLNSTQAFGTQSFWNNTTPTSSVFSVGANGNTNASGNDFIAYCFAPVAGYSAMGSYTGNGSSSDGVFVSLGFKPSFLLIKNITAGTAEYWILIDSARSPSNVANNFLYPNDSLAEGTQYFDVDLLSNGFKLRNSAAATNASTNTYIYYAVAENPFQANGGLAR